MINIYQIFIIRCVMRILVTGGAGFIGRHLVKVLINRGDEVTIVDNFSNSSKQEIKDLLDKGANLIEVDITNFEQINKAIRGHEIVIHLAAKISVEDSIKNPEETNRVNIDGTKNIINIMSKSNIKNLIVASSAAVYGDLKDIQSCLDEKSIMNPISPYGKSKLMMEKSIENLIHKSKINCIILRFFNIYGIGQNPEYAGVISKFVTNIKNQQALEIFGDGLQTRDFVSIHDIIESIILAMKKIKQKKFEVYNIASGKTITINSLATTLLEIFDKSLEIIHKPCKVGDIRHSKASISKAQLELGYYPKISLVMGLRQFLEK